MRRVSAAVAVTAVLLSLVACGQQEAGPGGQDGRREKVGAADTPGGGAEPVEPLYQLAVEPAEPLGLDLVTESNEVFSMDMPAGWRWETVGQFTQFGVRTWDPEHPERQVFFYSKMEPLTKSAAARDFYRQQAAWVAGDSLAQMYADAPVLDPPQVAGFFTLFDTYVAFVRAYGNQHTLPELAGFEVLEAGALQTPIDRMTVDDAVLLARFTAGGVPSEGLFAASVVDFGSYFVQGIDTLPLSVYNITGISASAGDFIHLQEDLTRSLASFAFTPEYVAAAERANEEGTEAMLQWAETVNGAYDSYNQTWWDRQPRNDALAQQDSDQDLGYDRLYDTETGEIYRAELGFYDAYDTNRDEYGNPNLQLIPQDDTPRWQQPIDYYITD